LRLRKRKPSLRVGLPVLAVGITMITLAYFGVQPLQNGKPPPCFPATCPSLAYFAFLGIAGFFVLLWGGLETISGLLIHEGALEYRTEPLPPPEPGSGSGDENILAMARELQHRVKRPKFGEITSLAWSEYQPWYWAGFKRKGIRKPPTLLLFAGLRERIGAEEWKLLLTYYFLLLKPRSRLLIETFAAIFGPLILLPFAGALISSALGLQASRIYAQFIGAPIAVALLILIFPIAKWLMLRQDRLTAELVGQNALLDLFKRIDSLQLPRIENAKRRQGWTLRLWPMPNMTERILNLTDRYSEAQHIQHS